MVDSGENERSLFLRADPDTASELLSRPVKKLSRDLESIKVNVTRAVDMTSVVAPVDYEGLGHI